MISNYRDKASSKIFCSVNTYSEELISISFWIKAGYCQDPPNKNGLAHLVEHMSFLHSKKFPELNQICKIVAGLGGVIEGKTLPQATYFWISGLKTKLPDYFSVLTDLIHNPIFKEESFEREREIILGSAKMSENDPYLGVWFLIKKVLFPNHPFGKSAEGEVLDVKGISLQDVKEFHKKFYKRKNLFVILSGTNTDELDKMGKLEILNKHKIKSFYTEPPPIPLIDEYINVEKRDISNTEMCIGMRVKYQELHELYELKLLNTLIGGNDNSRLYMRLRCELGVVYDFRSRLLESDRLAALIIYTGIPRAEKTSFVLEEVLKVLSDLLEKGVSEEELERCKNTLYGELLINLQDIDFRTEFMGKHILSSWIPPSPSFLKKLVFSITKERMSYWLHKIVKKHNMGIAVIGKNVEVEEIENIFQRYSFL